MDTTHDHGQMTTTDPHAGHLTTTDPHAGHLTTTDPHAGHLTTTDPHAGHHTTTDPHAGHYTTTGHDHGGTSSEHSMVVRCFFSYYFFKPAINYTLYESYVLKEALLSHYMIILAKKFDENYLRKYSNCTFT